MDIISNNPYRILGVLPGASYRDIEHNKHLINVFHKAGQVPVFSYDFENVFGQVVRTVESSNDAANKLSFNKYKVAYGLFWLHDASIVDKNALNILKEKSIWSAIRYLRICGRQDYSTYINLGCLSLACGNWADAIYCYSRLFDSREIWNQYVASVIGNLNVSYDEELYLFVDNLIAYFPVVNWKNAIYTMRPTVINKDALLKIDLSTSSIRKCLYARNEPKSKDGNLAKIEKWQIVVACALVFAMIVSICITISQTPAPKQKHSIEEIDSCRKSRVSCEDSIQSVEEYEDTTKIYNVTYHKTGDRPYKDFYGKGKYDKRTYNSLKIKNGSESDAVVFLESESGKKVRHVYIKKGENFKMIQIPGGIYTLKIYQGNSWCVEKNNGKNAPRGGFMKDVSMSKSGSNDSFYYPTSMTGRSIEYEVTLYKVSNGNLYTEGISKDEMFN